MRKRRCLKSEETKQLLNVRARRGSTRDEKKNEETNDAVSTRGKGELFSVSLSLVVRLGRNRLLKISHLSTILTFQHRADFETSSSFSLSLNRNHASNPCATSKLKMEEYFLAWVHEANNQITVRVISHRVVILRSSSLSVWTGFFDIFYRKQNIFLTFLPLCINRYQTRFTRGGKCGYNDVVNSVARPFKQ